MSKMDVDAAPPTAAASQQQQQQQQQAGSGFIITLHPLVIMNISDHFTRVKAQTGTSTPVFGALIGIQSGREIEIFNSFEVAMVVTNGVYSVDKELFATKADQYKQVFAKYDFLGWYTIGSQPTPAHIAINEQFIEYNENPLLLQLNPAIAATSKDLPIAVYETIVDLVEGGAPQMSFAKAAYKVETGEAERIAVDHVAQTAGSNVTTGSSLDTNLVSQRNAIKMLHSRIVLLQQYVQAVEAGELPRDHGLLRQISSVCKRLPTMDSPEFRKEFLVDYNDVLLTSYLAIVTKSSHAINQV
ncbi:COP9 signalosome complex subunit 6-like protein [Zopfochytrium polystomum]|nr:COP9 signalosome complex subunit 6-like protein [Zopfochytrium polystomum]